MSTKELSKQVAAKCSRCGYSNEECEAGTKKKSSMGKTFDELAKAAAVNSGRPITFMAALAVIFLWAVTGPVFKFNDTWQLVINTGTTIITFLMVFLIQNSQNRDGCAVQIKLDEIIRSLNGAKNDLIDLENKSEEELEELRSDYLKIAHEAGEQIEDLHEEEHLKQNRSEAA